MDIPETQRVILEAAETLFLSKGYSGTSMRDIASQAGYKSVAGLYNHFKDKESIFQALLEYRSPYPELFALISEIQGDTVEVFLREVFLKMTAYMRQHQKFVQLVLLDNLEFDAVHIHDLIGEMQAQLFTIFTRLDALEGLRQDIPPLVMIRMMGMQIFGYILTQRILPDAILDSMSETAWQEAILNILLNGMRKDTPHE